MCGRSRSGRSRTFWVDVKAITLHILRRLPVAYLRTLPERSDWLARALWRAILGLSTQERFQLVHDRRLWGSEESLSGTGSTVQITKALRGALPATLRRLGARSLLDVPCGDFNWLQHVHLEGIDYLGGDIVADLVAANSLRYGSPSRRFEVIDLVNDPLPRADAVLVRDCLVHLSLDEAVRSVANIRASGARWLLATTFPDVECNTDIPAGLWRPLNLQAPPFSLPPPESLIHEGHPEQQFSSKSIGIWPLA